MRARTRLYGVNIIIDHMITEDDEIKILEIQRAEDSCLSGFQDAYKGQNLQDKIDGYNERRSIKSGDEPILFGSFFDDKSTLAVFGYPVIPEFLPWQKAYVQHEGHPLHTDIRENCPSDKVVIKIPKGTCGGDGVFFTERDTMKFFGSETNSPSIWPFSEASELSVLSVNYVVAQECVTPRAISVQKKTFLPTIRTALSVLWSELGHSDPSIHIHGSYYKLPTLDIGTGAGDFVADVLKSNANEGIGAARIKDIDKTVIAEQVPSAIIKLFTYCRDHNPEDLILQNMESVNPANRVSALLYMRHLDMNGFEFSDVFAKACQRPWLSISQNLPGTLHISCKPFHELFKLWNSDKIIEAFNNVMKEFLPNSTGGPCSNSRENSLETLLKKHSPYILGM